MTVKQCDRCGKIVKEIEEFSLYEGVVSQSGLVGAFDLCEECASAFYNSFKKVEDFQEVSEK